MKEFNAWVICLRTGVIKLIMKREKKIQLPNDWFKPLPNSDTFAKNTYMYCNYSTKVRKQITQ